MEYWYEQLAECGKAAVVDELRALLPSRFWVRVKELLTEGEEKKLGMEMAHDYDHPMTAREKAAYHQHGRYLEVLQGITSERTTQRTLGY